MPCPYSLASEATSQSRMVTWLRRTWMPSIVEPITRTSSRHDVVGGVDVDPVLAAETVDVADGHVVGADDDAAADDGAVLADEPLRAGRARAGPGACPRAGARAAAASATRPRARRRARAARPPRARRPRGRARRRPRRTSGAGAAGRHGRAAARRASEPAKNQQRRRERRVDPEGADEPPSSRRARGGRAAQPPSPAGTGAGGGRRRRRARAPSATISAGELERPPARRARATPRTPRGTAAARPRAATRAGPSACTTSLDPAEEAARGVLHPDERVRGRDRPTAPATPASDSVRRRSR